MGRATTRTPRSAEMLSTHDAAVELGGMTPAQVSRWCAAGLIRGAVRLPGRAGWRIHRRGWELFKRERTPRAARRECDGEDAE